jgi:glycerol-3-phosphate dehydrogenase
VRLGLLVEKGAIPILGKIRSICESVMPWSDERWMKEIDDYSRLWNDCYSPVRKDIT